MMISGDDTETRGSNNDSLLVSSSDNNFDSSTSSNSLTVPTKANKEDVSLRIKASIDNKDVKIVASKKSNISSIKDNVRDALGPTATNRYLRLICKGRLLAPDSAKLESFPIEDGDVIHAVLAAAGVRGGQQAALARGNVSSRRYRGTGVGPLGRVVRSSSGSSGLTSRFGSSSLDAGELSDGSSGIDDDGNDTDEESGMQRERLGFDRLRSSGLSRAEITAIRAYFSRSVDRYIQNNRDMVFDNGSNSDSNNNNNNNNENNNSGNATSGGVDLMRRRLQYEDAWMSEQGPTSEFRLNLNHTNPLLQASLMSATLRGRNADGTSGNSFPIRASVGTDRDFLYGFLLGFFVGFLMLVWVWMPTVPHKQKLGILTGISLQLALSLLRSSSDDEDYDLEIDQEYEAISGV